jgi:hypothetical protein
VRGNPARGAGEDDREIHLGHDVVRLADVNPLATQRASNQ